MIRPKVLVVADTVIRDASRNTMSLINVHEQFYPAGYPLLIPRFTAFALFEREQADPAVSQPLLAIRLDQDLLFEGPIPIDFGNGLTTRSVLQFQGFVLPRPGTIRLTITAGDQQLESYPLAAFPVGTPAPQPVA